MVDPKHSLERVSLARAQPLFARLDEEEMGRILRMVTRVALSPGEVLFRRGAEAEAFWALEAPTSVALFADEPGEGAPIALVQGGGALGEMALIQGAAHSLTAVVAQGGAALRMRSVDFERLRERGDAVAFKLLRQMDLDLCARIRCAAARVDLLDPGLASAPVDFSDGNPVEPSEIDLFPVFRGAAGTVRLALEQMLREKEVEPGEALMREGEPGRALFCVASGEVVVRWRWGAVARFRAGSVFGLLSLVDGGGSAASAEAAETSRIWSLAAEDFELLHGASHPFGHALVDMVARGLVARLKSANAALLSQGVSGADEGLARLEISRMAAMGEAGG